MKDDEGATQSKPQDWKETLKREGGQLGSTWIRWWIVLTMLGITEHAFGIVRQLQFPWNWQKYLLVAVFATSVALLEWAALAGFRWVGRVWKRSLKGT